MVQLVISFSFSFFQIMGRWYVLWVMLVYLEQTFIGHGWFGNMSGGDPASEDVAAQNNLPTNGSEWVDLFVSEMMNASDMDDAKARASRILEVLEKSIASRAGVEAAEGFQKVLLGILIEPHMDPAYV